VPAGAEEKAVRRGLAAIGSDLRVVVTRIGALGATEAARRALAVLPMPTGVVGLGLCGLVSAAFAVGEPLIYGELVGAGETALAMTPELVRVLATSLPSAQTGIRVRDVARIVTSAVEKREIAERDTVQAVDMESFSLARVFVDAGVPFASVRVGSDGAERDLPDLERTLDGSGGVDPLALLLAMGRSPLAAARLAIGATAALRALTRIAQAIASTSPVAS